MTDPLAPPARFEDPLPRDTLDGRWEIRSILPGAMGTVLLLTDPATGGRFAAKTPRVEMGLSQDTLRRFEAEARTWLSLGHHENVVEAFFYETIRWRDVERPFLFLEYVDGPTLDRVVRLEERLAVPVVLDLASGIAWGMSFAHGEGRTGSRVVHRDLKPDNVFVTSHRIVKVSDFGIARALDRPEEAAGEGLGLGTPFYAAPEQMRDARRADVRSDVYSFGALVHEMVAGEPPFPAGDLSTLVWKVLKEEPKPLRARFPDVPEVLDRLVLDCLAKEPSARPQHFTDVLERLGDIREVDALWAPARGARSCEACGWMSLTGRRSCSLCGKRTTKGVRYAPSSPRWDRKLPTMGRGGGEADPFIEGVHVRPRSPRAGEEVVVTVLVGNRGSAPAEGVAVPYVRPSRDAFAFVEARARRGFRGTVPPTAPGAPLRVSWTLRPLREGRWTLRAPRLSWRGSDGRRRNARGEQLAIDVQANDAIPLVGREEERAELAKLIDAAAAGTGAAALVLGRPGMGKSRLARELTEKAREHGFAPARGRCLDRGSEVRGALKEALRQLLDLPKTGSGGPEIAAALVSYLGDATRGEPRLLPFLVGELTGRAAAAGENAAHLWTRLASVAGRGRPIALVIEDVQRDPEVGSIVLSMAVAARRDHARFVALLSARKELEEGEGAELVRRFEDDAADTGLSRVLRLGPLSNDEVASVLAASFRPNDFETSAPWLADEIHALSGGNPLFVTELVKALRTRTHSEGGKSGVQLLVTKDGLWTAGASLSPAHLRAEVPPRVEQLVVDRVSALPPQARRFAHAAAVLGDVFETELLRELLGDPAEFAGSLEVLEADGLLREVDGDPPRIRFREPLLPDALQASLRTRDPAEFSRLHAHAAELLTQRPGARGRNALRLGRHLRAAGRPDRAFSAFLDAAQRLIERQAWSRAAAVLDEAQVLLDHGLRPRRSERSDFALLRGDALRRTGSYEGALAAYRAVVEQTSDSGGGKGSPATLGAVYAQMGRVHEALGQTDEALYCHAISLSIRREQGLAFDAPESLVDLASLHLQRGEYERAGQYLDEALAETEKTGNTQARGRALVLRARMHVGRGETRVARTLLRRGLQEARAARDDTGVADAWSVVGQACFREGRPVRALVHFRRALRLRQSAGLAAAVAASWGSIGAALEATGDLENAQSAFERAAALGRRTKSLRGLAASLTNLGRVQLAAGLPRKARATLEEAWATVSEGTLGEMTLVASTAAELTAALVALGEVGPAAGFAEEGVRRARDCGDHDLEAYATLRLAEARAAGGRIADARAEIASALGVAGVSPHVRTLVLVAAAELAADPALAAAWAAEAAELAALLTNPSTRARALAAKGRADLRLGDAAAAAVPLRQAAGLLLSVGRPEPLLHGVLRDLAAALAGADPDAAAAAERRAADVARDLASRGYDSRLDIARPPGGGALVTPEMPLDPSPGDA